MLREVRHQLGLRGKIKQANLLVIARFDMYTYTAEARRTVCTRAAQRFPDS